MGDASTIGEALDAWGLAEAIRSGETTAEEEVEAAIARIEADDHNAVVIPMFDAARRQVETGLPSGPLRGVPILIKDITLSTPGYRTTSGCAFTADFKETEESAYVQRLKRAGAVILGKTNTCELGMGLACEPRLHGPTFNPRAREHTTGGSSGGSAAAVAAELVPVAQGGDGFGSIRVPAACCGVIGMKPTRARNPMGPLVRELLSGMASIHVLSRSVRDQALFLDTTHGMSPGDPYAAPEPKTTFVDAMSKEFSEPLRIAKTVDAEGIDVHPSCREAVETTAARLRSLGHQVEEISAPLPSRKLFRDFRTLIEVATASALSAHPQTGRPARQNEVERATWETAERGRAHSALDHEAAIAGIRHATVRLETCFTDFDALLTPVTATPPARLGHHNMDEQSAASYWSRVEAFSPFCVWFNAGGQPAISLPTGTMDGLPIGVQIATRFGEDALLLRLAAQLETSR